MTLRFRIAVTTRTAATRRVICIRLLTLVRVPASHPRFSPLAFILAWAVQPEATVRARDGTAARTSVTTTAKPACRKVQGTAVETTANSTFNSRGIWRYRYGRPVGTRIRITMKINDTTELLG